MVRQQFASDSDHCGATTDLSFEIEQEGGHVSHDIQCRNHHVDCQHAISDDPVVYDPCPYPRNE